MKLIQFFLAMLSCTAVSVAQGSPVVTAPAEATPMAKAIAETTFVTEHKPSTEAKYYIFLASASWCGPCRMVTPKVVQEYPNMMANKDVEVILLSCDSNPEKAKEYLKHYNAPFAAVMYGSKEAAKLPGYPADVRGIPHMVMVDANGKMIYQGHGIRTMEWKKQIEAAQTAQK